MILRDAPLGVRLRITRLLVPPEASEADIESLELPWCLKVHQPGEPGSEFLGEGDTLTRVDTLRVEVLNSQTGQPRRGEIVLYAQYETLGGSHYDYTEVEPCT